MDVREREQAALLALLRQGSGRRWNQIAADVSYEGSALALLTQANEEALFADPAALESVAEAATDIQRWNDAGLRFVTVLDDEYPARLRDIHETPPFLFYEGALRPDDQGMSVVGSRTVSPWGVNFAEEAAALLVARELTVISGLAAGVDAAAHRAALHLAGRTVAFLGTGVNRSYPPENSELQREIAEKGLLLSQFYPDAPPSKQSFPIRNAAMSGYGQASIVVEASEHSGTRIQTRVAGQHGRPVILTTKVVDATTWGKSLAGSPNVYVVNSSGDLSAAIDAVLDRTQRVESALKALQ